MPRAICQAMEIAPKLWKAGEQVCRRLEEEFSLWESHPRIASWQHGGRVLLLAEQGVNSRRVVEEFTRRNQLPLRTVPLSSWCMVNSTRNLFKQLEQSPTEGSGVILLTDAELLVIRDPDIGLWERAFLCQARDLVRRYLPHLAAKAGSPNTLQSIQRQFFIAVANKSEMSGNASVLAPFTSLNLQGPDLEEIQDRVEIVASTLRLTHSPSFSARKIAEAARRSVEPDIYIEHYPAK